MYKTIAIAVDGSQNAKRAAEEALEIIALCPGVQVELLYVVSPGNEIEALHSPEVFDEVESGSVAYPIMQMMHDNDINAKGVRLYGRPADAICTFAKENDVDLIVMGCRGLSGFKKLTVGSVSQRVIKLAACPVLIVK